MKQTLQYRVDPSGIIVSIEGPWDEFAVGNDAKRSVTRKETLGKNLLRLIKGQGVQHVYKMLQDYLLAHPEKKAVFDYRCDGVGIRRFMNMEVQASNGQILYRSTIEREERAPELKPIDYDRAGEIFVVLCSFCKAFRYPQDSEDWRPLEDLFGKVPETFSVSHSVCPVCFDKLMDEMEGKA